jgi:hypothetical protein
MRQMGDVPKHDVLLLYSLIVLVISKLSAGAECPRDVLARVGPPDRHIEIGELVSFTIIS